MDPTPKIGGLSVVIPHYGDPALAQGVVDRLRRQSGQRRLQIIVVDDASPVPFPQMDGVTVLTRDQNGGFGAAVNTGAAVADAPWLLVLNSDLEIEVDFVDSLCACAERWPPAVAGVALRRPDGGLEWTARHWPRISQFVVEWLTPLARIRGWNAWHRAVGHDVNAIDSSAQLVDWIAGAVMLLPLDAFHRVGGFDPSYFMYSEDVDLQRRLRQAGVPALYLGSVSAIHLGGASAESVEQRVRWVTSSRLAYLRRWSGNGACRQMRACLLVASVVNLAWNSARHMARRNVSPLERFRFELSLVFGSSSAAR